MADFIGLPDVKPLPSHGACAVVSCPRQLPAASSTYCDAHLQRLRCLRRAGQEPGEAAWRLTEPPVPRSGQVSLAGLTPAVVMEVLFGLQQRSRQGVKINDTILPGCLRWCRRQQVTSLIGMAIPASRGNGYARVVNTLIAHARRGLSGPETEKAKDIWDMTVFGHRGRLAFAGDHQQWLRQGARIGPLRICRVIAGAEAPPRPGTDLQPGAAVREPAPAPDRGELPAALGRADIEAFLNRLGYLDVSGEISGMTRVLACRGVRKVLAAARQLGVTRPGGPAEGLSDQFALHHDDMPDEPERGEPGRDLPPEIMRQMCEHLDDLAALQIRTATEIVIDTGRRPEDVVGLPLDCLARGKDGAPVLVYDNAKANRLGRRLPIAASTAQVISGQQERVRARFPHTPPAELKLLPAGWANRDGRRPMTVSTAEGRAPRVEQLAAAAAAARRRRDSARPGSSPTPTGTPSLSVLPPTL